MLRILSGEFRSRILESPPDGEVTRPYLARIRESVCGMLHGWFEGARVLDLFAGVGTVGLEAVSRGAAHVLMVEQDRRIHELLRRNVENLGCGDRAEFMLADALGSACLLRAPAPLDLVFVDPPYPMMRDEKRRGRVLRQIEQCRPLMADPSFVVLRSPVGPRNADLAVPGFDGPEAHAYGHGSWVLLYAPAAPPAGPGAAGSPTNGESGPA